LPKFQTFLFPYDHMGRFHYHKIIEKQVTKFTIQVKFGMKRFTRFHLQVSMPYPTYAFYSALSH
jgi:hypothetical protein